jgi:hypothetical protein
MNAPTTSLPGRGDWVRIGPHGQEIWYQVLHAPHRCAQCPAGWSHLWLQPWQGGRLGPVRFVVTALDGLVVRRPERPPGTHTGLRLA